jgi:hypothetical protein
VILDGYNAGRNRDGEVAGKAKEGVQVTDESENY